MSQSAAPLNCPAHAASEELAHEGNTHCHCHGHNHQEAVAPEPTLPEDHVHGEHEGHDHCHDHSHAEPGAPDPALAAQASDTVAVYRIVNMDCPMEEALIRKKLASVKGIDNLTFNLLQRVLTVEHAPGIRPEIEAALKAIDMNPEPLQGSPRMEVASPSIPWKGLVIATLLAAGAEFVDLWREWSGVEITPQWERVLFWLSFALSALAIAISGTGTFRKGWRSLVTLHLDINALMAVAVTGAVLIGQFPEAAMVMVLFNVSEAIEARALDRVRRSIQDLVDLAPPVATVMQPDGSWREMPLAEIQLQSLIRVRPGEKIALDGVVVEGESTINQAPITGESMPARKSSGDEVYAGTLNETGSLVYQVTALVQDTTLARIINAVENAQASRAPMQRFVDIFAKYYTPAIFLFALLWAVCMPLIFHSPWLESVYTALVILVIGCPCALVISTPVTVVSGLSAAARNGILVKGGLYLELGRRINWLALDKTGTLTVGRPQLVDVVPLALDSAEALELAQALATLSDHPVSLAIAAGCETKNGNSVSGFQAIPGHGVSGEIAGTTWYLANPSFIHSLGIATPEMDAAAERLEEQGKTVVALANGQTVAALFAVADTVREDTAEAIRQLRQLNVKTIMLTGDNAKTAKTIAAETGVNEWRAPLLPEQKLEVIEELESQGNIVAMVGDGINDAPALAAANIGFAMGAGGTDTAMETADVALMDDDLRKIPRFIRLSRSTFTVLVENIALALGIKAVFFGLTLAGLATMWMAVFADVGAALLVVGNGLRVRGK